MGDVTKISVVEMLGYQEERIAITDGELETGNISLPFLDEDGMVERSVSQFTWSAKINPPFTHSSEVTSAVGTTLGKLGR